MRYNYIMWFVYIVRCADDSLYTGITTDVSRRVKEHNGEAGTGSKYTRSQRPVVMVYKETAATRSAALKRERSLKKLSRARKLAVIAANLTKTPSYDTMSV